MSKIGQNVMSLFSIKYKIQRYAQNENRELFNVTYIT